MIEGREWYVVAIGRMLSGDVKVFTAHASQALEEPMLSYVCEQNFARGLIMFTEEQSKVIPITQARHKD